MPDPSRGQARSRLAVDERRQQLLAIGLELFSRHGYEELGVDEIAQVAGISKGLIYHYFESKHGFYVACLREAAADLLQRTEPATSGTPEQILRRGLEAYLDYVEQHAQAYVTLYRGGIGFDEDVYAVVEETRRRFVERMLEDREVGADDPRLRVALRGFIGFVEASALDWLDHRDLDRGALVELFVVMARATIDAALG